jgi:SAM-dependent methyltransferase
MPNVQVLIAPQELLIIGAAVKTGIIEQLAKKPMTADELALEISADNRAVWVVTEALEALGYLSKDENKLRLSEEAVNMLYNKESNNYTGFSFMHRYNVTNSWIHLPEVIRSGQPFPRETGQENTEYFMAAMSQSARENALTIAGFCLAGSGDTPKVLDIGGGPLTYARAFAASGAKVTVQDLPHVVEYMSTFLNENENIEMFAGDFNLGLSPGPYDLAFLGNICHIFGERENRELFKKVAAVLKTDGKINIVDFVRGTNPMAAVFGVNMLVNTKNGGAWTFAEYSEWLVEAGFSNPELNPVGGRQVLSAQKR